MPNNAPVPFNLVLNVYGHSDDHTDGESPVDSVMVDATAFDMRDPEHRAVALGQLEIVMAARVGQKPNVNPT